MLSSLVNNCKTITQLRSCVNLYFNKNKIEDKYSRILRSNLSKQTDFKKALQSVYNYILNQEFPMKQNDTAIIRYKGNSISGMECHSYGHR